MIAYENRCGECSYSFSGLGAGPLACPECGAQYSRVTPDAPPEPRPAGWLPVTCVLLSALVTCVVFYFLKNELAFAPHVIVCLWAGIRTAPLYLNREPKIMMDRIYMSLITAIFLGLASFGLVALLLFAIAFALFVITRKL